MCFIKCGAQSLGAVLEGQKVMYLSHGRVPYQTASFNDTILLHILYGSHVHILNKNYQNVYALILHVPYHIQYLLISIYIDCKNHDLEAVVHTGSGTHRHLQFVTI